MSIESVRQPSGNAGLKSVQPSTCLLDSSPEGLSAVESVVESCCKLVSEAVFNPQHRVQEGSTAAVLYPAPRPVGMFVIEVEEHQRMVASELCRSRTMKIFGPESTILKAPGKVQELRVSNVQEVLQSRHGRLAGTHILNARVLTGNCTQQLSLLSRTWKSFATKKGEALNPNFRQQWLGAWEPTSQLKLKTKEIIVDDVVQVAVVVRFDQFPGNPWIICDYHDSTNIMPEVTIGIP